MSTLHADALEDAFYEAIQKNPQMAAVAAEVRTRLLEGGFYSSDIVNAAFQKWERDRKKITLIDAYGFAQVWAHFHRGDIAHGSVPLPSGPGSDQNLEYNQSVLDQLPAGFRATYSPERGPGADDDGTLTIEKGIGLWRVFREDADEYREEPWFFKMDHKIALEVGTTSVSKTLYHLRCRGGVARWPYGYEKIIVLAGVKTNPFSFKVEHYMTKGGE